MLLIFFSNACAFSPYSNQELDELEKQFVELINQSPAVIRNPLARDYINQLGARLAFKAQMAKPYFFIVKSNEINAFAGPGGYIGINSQLILATSQESELAAVMAHELAHVRLHHLYNLIEHEKQMQIPMLASLLASMALGALNPVLGTSAMMASLTGFNQHSINFTRAKEKEADRIGIDMLVKARFNPHAMAGFFKKMQQNSRYYYTANIPAILRSHPLDDDRIAEAENRIGQLNALNFSENNDYPYFKALIFNQVTHSPQVLSYYKTQCTKQKSSMICQYGYALALINTSHAKEAEMILEPLTNDLPDNLFIQLAYVNALVADHRYQLALNKLTALKTKLPYNYALDMTYSDALTAAGKFTQASNFLLKSYRKFSKDLPMCQALAYAQSKTHQKAYAYFTQARCFLLQGLTKKALYQLSVAKKLSSHDEYLTTRIEALVRELE